MMTLIGNIINIITIIPMIIAGASLICSLTPTPADDKWIAKAYKVLDWCALNVGRAKDK